MSYSCHYYIEINSNSCYSTNLPETTVQPVKDHDPDQEPNILPVIITLPLVLVIITAVTVTTLSVILCIQRTKNSRLSKVTRVLAISPAPYPFQTDRGEYTDLEPEEGHDPDISEFI